MIVTGANVFFSDDGRLMTDCEACSGTGETISLSGGYNYAAIPTETAHPCERCGGEGRYEVPIEDIWDVRTEEEIEAVPLIDYLASL